MKRILLPVAIAAAVLGTAACERSTTAARTDDLTLDEAVAVATQMGSLTVTTLGATGGGLFSVSPDEAAPVFTSSSMTVPFDNTALCPRGGALAVKGQADVVWDAATRTGTVDVSATSTPAQCAAENGKGAVLTFTGDPSTQVHATGSSTSGLPGKLTVTQKGAFKWQRTGGASGRCAVDLTSVADPATQTLHVTGSFCGIAVDATRSR